MPQVEPDLTFRSYLLIAFLGSGWKPSVVVTYSEGGKNLLRNITIDQIFPTCDEAEQAGLAYVRKWIDDGKPDLGL
jgi:hypothetical protein